MGESVSVQDILAAKGGAVHTIESNLTLAQVAQILVEKDIGALVVTDASGGIVGMISERDLARALAKFGAETGQISVAQVMTKDVVACSINDEPAYLLTLMTEARCRHLPVVRMGELVGMVSIGDVVRAVNI